MHRRSGTRVGRVATVLALCAAPAAAQVATETTSWGWSEAYEYQYDGRRNDAYQTRLVGVVDGVDVAFDLTFHRAIDDGDVVAAMRDVLATRGIASGGRPGVLTWSGPAFVDGYEEFVDSFTEVTYSTWTQTFTTVQVTSGDAPGAVALVGDRGYCYDTGTSGETNFGGFGGAFASCDNYEEFVVEAGTVNTNTHTGTVVTTVERWFTNEDFLNVGEWRYTGTVTLIGTVHTAVQASGLDLGAAFSRHVLKEGADIAGEGRPVRTWLGGHAGDLRQDGDGDVAGNRRRWSTLAGGVVVAPAPGWHVGLAAARARADIDVDGAPEWADVELDQFALHGGWRGGRGFVTGLLGRGRGDVAAVHGDATLGGVSAARYGLRVDQAALEGGWRVAAGQGWVQPLAGIERTRVRNDGFVEDGGIALVGDEHRSARTRAWIGLEAGHTWRHGHERALALAVGARYARVLAGEARQLPVALATAPGSPLAIDGGDDRDGRVQLAFDLRYAFNRHVTAWLGIEGGGDGRIAAEVLGGGLRIDW